MKKMRAIAAILLVCMMVSLFAACSILPLRGTYTSKDGLIEQSFTFKEDNKVEVSAFGVDVEGEYEIEGDEITITYSLLGFSYDMVKDFERDGSSIFIDGIEFVKEK